MSNNNIDESFNSENKEKTSPNKRNIVCLILGSIFIIFLLGIICFSLLLHKNKREKKVEIQTVKQSEPLDTTKVEEIKMPLSAEQINNLTLFIEHDAEENKKKQRRFLDPGDNNVDSEGVGNNDSKSDIADSNKCVAILFNYGSSNDTGNIFLRRFFGGENLPINEENLETAEIIFELNSFINEIPVDKRENAKFKIIGYSDNSFRNGIPDEGKESRIFNEELSQKRANFIKTILQEYFHVSPFNFIEVKGRGFQNPWKDKITENGKDIIKYNPEKSRRVEVFCYYEK